MQLMYIFLIFSIIIPVNAFALEFIRCPNVNGSMQTITYNLNGNRFTGSNNVKDSRTVYSGANISNVYVSCPKSTKNKSLQSFWSKGGSIRSYNGDVDGVSFYNIDDKMSVGLTVSGENRLGKSHKLNNPGYRANESFPVGDNNIKVIFKLSKPLNNKWSWSGELYTAYIWLGKTNVYNGNEFRDPAYELYINAEVNAEQSCQINAGQEISFEFGDIKSTAFRGALTGKKPNGVNKQRANISVKCSNGSSDAAVSLKITSSDVKNNIIISDNKDLGFVISDDTGHELTPNDGNSKVKFKLTDGSYNTSLQAWPVSVTGKTPQSGKFTAYGFINVTFD